MLHFTRACSIVLFTSIICGSAENVKSWPPILYPASDFVANRTVYEVDLLSLDIDTKLSATTLQGDVGHRTDGG